ncbi:hypothetical protein JKF63_06461 [Porcisia hertigi]|uniref:Uncharacterized protein n=1 Tax=Porcisia hertigi TaxID=2761500 RepID=A0A836YHE8_9TRYP|nr:hypothetical protein JKF63_06461 [Porcisia hertigi]
MSSSTSPSTSAGCAVGKSSSRERQQQSPFTDAALAERAGGCTRVTTGSQLSLKSLSQLPFVQASAVSPRARPATSTSVECHGRVDDTAAVHEREQRMEFLGLIERLRSLLMPATERLIRLRGALKVLQEQVMVVTPTNAGTAVGAAPGGTSAGLSIASMSVAEPLSGPRLCVAGASDQAVEEVFHFIVHRDPPAQRCGTGTGASGGGSPAVNGASGSGGRPPTPDIGLCVFPQMSPFSIAGRRRSRFESGGGSPGANRMTPGGHPGASVSSVSPTGVIGFGDEGKAASPGASSFRFPSTPPLAPSLMSAAQATVHDTLSTSGVSHPCSPVMTGLPSPDQFPLPMMHSRGSLNAYARGTRAIRDNTNPPSQLPKGTSLPPLRTAAPTATATTTVTRAGSGGGSVGRLPSVAAAAAHEPHQRCSPSPSQLPLVNTLGCLSATPPAPPLPAAPTNHHMRRVRSMVSYESHAPGDTASGPLINNAEALSCSSRLQPPSQMLPHNTASLVEMSSDGVDRSASTASMSLSSTMPDLPVIPPPPLPGFSALGALEGSGAPSCTPSSLPNTSTAEVSPPSPKHQSISASVAMNQTPETTKSAVFSSFRRRTGNSPALAGPSFSLMGEFSSLPTPIMVNPLHRTLSQCSEVSEQLHHHHRSRPSSSVAFGTARFVTLPTPFSSRGRGGMQSSPALTLREDSAILSRVSSFAPPVMRFVQRARRRVLSVSQMQLSLSAWDLFYRDHTGSRVQTAFQSASTVSGLSSPLVSRAFGDQRNCQPSSGLRIRMSGSGSRLGVSRHPEYISPLGGAQVMPEVSPQTLLGPQWLVSISEDGMLRYSPMPSTAQPRAPTHFTPVSITSDYAFFCVPYEAVACGLGPEGNRGGSSSAANVLGVSAGGVGVSVNGGGEMREVGAVLDTLFGIFRGGIHEDLQAQEQRPKPHNATAGAKSILVTAASNGGGVGATLSTPVVPPDSSSFQDSEDAPSQQRVCAGDVDTGGVSDSPRTRQGMQPATNDLPASQPAAGRHSLNAARARSQSDTVSAHAAASSPRVRLSSAGPLTAVDCASSASEPQHSADRLDKSIARSSPHCAETPGLSSTSSDEWLLPLRQALVDRTIFLLVKASNLETPTPSRRPASTTGGMENSDGAMEDGVVQRFITFAKTHYGVTVHPWRVVVFSNRDATRARNVMLAVYAQRHRHQQKRKSQQSTSPCGNEELPMQIARSAGTAGGNAEGQVATREGKRSLPLSPIGFACMTPEVPGVGNLDSAKTSTGASLMSNSRLTLESSIGGSDERCTHIVDVGRSHISDGAPCECADFIYTLLTQELSVPPLLTALEQYKPLLECLTATALTPGSPFQVNFSSGAVFATTTTTVESKQDLVDTAHQPPGPAGSVAAIEHAVPVEVGNHGAESPAVAAALAHAQEVVWRSSGAAGVCGALGYFQHAAPTHRMAKTAFLLMAWSWQLSALLPLIIDDTQSRYNQLWHNGVHAHRKLQAVRQSLALHLAASPAKSVSALEVRLQEGFRDMTQRFLKDLRRLFLSTGAATAAPASSTTAGTSTSSRTSTGPPEHRARQQQAHPLLPLDALRVYDSPGLQEAYRRLAGAVSRFHAFYLHGQLLAFDEQILRQAVSTRQGLAPEGKPSQPLWPTSVYEQRYAAIRDAERLSNFQRCPSSQSSEDVNACPSAEPCALPSSLFSTGVQPRERAAETTTTATPKPSNPRLTPASPDSAASAAARIPKREVVEAPALKVGLVPHPRPHNMSPTMNASRRALSSVDGPTLQRFAGHGESAATPASIAVKSGGVHELGPQEVLSMSFPVSAARGPAGAAASASATKPLPSSTKGRVSARRSAPRPGHKVRAEDSPPADDVSADIEGASRRRREELQRVRLDMERQLITHVSQINTEIINFLLATCVSAIPHLQRDCVDAELARVKNAQVEIVTTFTKAVRGRRDVAIAVSQLYTQLDEWITDMSRLVSMVRSRPYLERFITQLRAVLCEDEVRALAVFRDGCGDERGSQETERLAQQVAGTPGSSLGAGWMTGNGAARSPLPGRSGTSSGTGRSSNPEDSTRKGGRAEQGASTPSFTNDAPHVFPSKSLASEVGHRSARMLRYFTRLICSQHGCKDNPTLCGSGTALNAQRSAVFGEMLASPSPSRSLRSLSVVSPILTSARRSPRAKRDGGGSLGLSVSLSSMSTAWNREEECCRVECGPRGQQGHSPRDNTTTADPFFATLTPSPMMAVCAEVLAMLGVPHSQPLLSSPCTPAAQTALDFDSKATALERDVSPPAKPKPASGVRGMSTRQRKFCSADGTSLEPNVVTEDDATTASAAHTSVNAEGSAWHKKLAQWRAVMTETERPSGDASAAPLLWIVLDVWDETLLRMPYGLLLELDTLRYAESLNGISGDLMDTQKSWVSLCKESLSTIGRQLKALQEDIKKMCREDGGARVEYTQELRAVFDAASSLVALPPPSSPLSAMTACPRASLIHELPDRGTGT